MHPWQLKLVFIFIFLHTFYSVNAQLQSTVIGNAIDQGDNCFTITPDQFNQAGGVWFSNPIDFDEDFTIYYQNNFGTKDSNGADGMALVFKGTSIPEIGAVGGGMGYEGINNSLIVEFDTFQNDSPGVGSLGDPVFDHVAILRDGNPSHNSIPTALTSAVPISNNSPNVEDGIDHEVKIVWDSTGQEFLIFFDCEFVLSIFLDIKTVIFNGDDTVFFGFVGSTGGLSNLHQVCFNSISFVDDLQLQDESICDGDFITVDATLPSGDTYSWSPTTGVGSPNSPVTIISPPSTTTYTVTITDVCGDSTTEDITISVLDNEDPVFDAAPEYCFGDAIPALPTTSNNGISGTWSPAIDNTQTTTYTFTPNEGECGTVTTLDIIVNPLDTPFFNAVSDKCEGDPIPDLPTTSTNGISGTWSPPIDNTQTTTYTFSPNADECAQTTTLQIVIVPTVTPSFDTIQEYCVGDVIPELPTTSNNGITGIWSPAIDNTQTTTYTFTPTDDAQCSTTTTLDIVVNPNISPIFDPYPDYNAGDLIQPLPTTSLNGITGTWSPAINNTQTTTYTFTPDAGQCATSQTLTIVVFSVDTDGDGVANGLDIDDDNDGILDENEQGFENLASASFNPFLQAWQSTSIDVIAGEDYQINPSGFSLPQVLVTGGPYNGQVIQQAVIFDNSNGRWADLDGNTYTNTNTFIGVEAPTAIPFANLQASDFSTQLTYVALVDTNGNGNYDVGIDQVIHPIFSVTGPITITPNVSGELFIVFADTFYSDNEGSLSFNTSINTDIDSDNDGLFNRIDLDSDNDGIPDNVEAQSTLGYISPSGLLAGITDVDNDGLDDNYDQDTNSSSTETSIGLIPVNTDADDDADFIDNDSDDDGFLDIEENGLADAISNPFADNDGDGIDDVFDIFDGFNVNNGIEIPETDLPDCNNNVLTDGDLDYREEVILPTFDVPGPICAGDVLDDLPLTSNNGITGTWSPPIDNTQTTTYTFTPDDISCGQSTSLEIVVNQPVIPQFDAVDPICVGDILNELPTTSNNGISGNWTPAINNTQTTTYTFTPNDNECAESVTLEIEVDPILIPQFDQPESFCSGEAIEPLPSTSINGINGTWTPDIDNTQTTVYTFTPNDGECGEVTTLEIEIIDTFTPVFDVLAAYCIGDDIPPLPTTSQDGIIGVWSPDINNTETTTYIFTPAPNQGCPTEASLTIEIDQGTVPEFSIVESICEGDVLEELPSLSDNGFTGVWSPALNNLETTTYTFSPDDEQCALETEVTINVDPVNEIELNAVVISDPFDPTIIVQLNVLAGNGSYEYRVNGGPWQTSNTFSNLTSGTENLFEARQINGCSNIASDKATGLTFPQFFTPNGDGFNEFWNIKGLRNQSNALIYIFDRYGKLLVQILPTQAGWDGYYKGKPMPSQDYWFRVEFNDLVTGNRISYNNHFTLKR